MKVYLKPMAPFLIVDDSVYNRLILKAYLKNTNFKVVEAENGAIAVEKAIKEYFDVIFMDIQMPVMNGCDATLAIRKQLLIDTLNSIQLMQNNQELL
jgi:CheY-like chemotaxis protein